MFKLRSISKVVGCLALAMTTSAFASFDPEFSLSSLHPFVGVDLQGRHMDYEPNFGDTLFAHTYPQYDAYAGLRFWRYFGISFGFENSSTKERNVRYLEGEVYLGFILPEGFGRATHYSEAKIKGAHVDLWGYIPVCPKLDVDVLVGLGLVRNKLNLVDITTHIDDIALDDPIVRTYEQRHTHPRLSFGIQKTFCKHIGIRALVAWENTSKFEDLKPVEVPDTITNVNVDDSVVYGLGVFAIL